MSKYAKAIWSGAIAFTGSLVVALADNSVTLSEMAVVLATTVAATGAVYQVKNSG